MLGFESFLFDVPIAGLPRQSVTIVKQQFGRGQAIQRQLQGNAPLDIFLGDLYGTPGFIIHHVKDDLPADFARVDTVDPARNADRIFSRGEFQRIVDGERAFAVF